MKEWKKNTHKISLFGNFILFDFVENDLHKIKSLCERWRLVFQLVIQNVPMSTDYHIIPNRKPKNQFHRRYFCNNVAGKGWERVKKKKQFPTEWNLFGKFSHRRYGIRRFEYGHRTMYDNEIVKKIEIIKLSFNWIDWYFMWTVIIPS